MPTKKNKNTKLSALRAVTWGKQFERDYKNARTNRKADPATLRQVMEAISRREKLPPSRRDHKLTGKYPGRGGESDCRECHVGNDWLLIYRFPDDASVAFIRTGTHSDLFG